MLAIKKIKNIINIKEWGGLECLFIAYPILSGWLLGSLPLYLFTLVVMDIIAYRRYCLKTRKTSKRVKALFWFVMTHNLVWIFVISDVPSYYFNSWVGMVITMGSIFFIAPVVEYTKMIKPLIVFTAIAACALVYQIILFSSGTLMGQMAIPPFSPSRVIEEIETFNQIRPSGLFAEPAAYSQFMCLPLFVSLINRKFIISLAIVVLTLLTTSTTGLVVSIFMVAVYFLTQRVPLKLRLLIVIGAVAVGLLMTHSDLFEATIDKAKNTELSENERTGVGLSVLTQLNAAELAFGIPYHDVTDMYADHKLRIQTFTFDSGGKEKVFVPTFWNIWFTYGIIGLILYLLVYLEFFKKSHVLLPYLLVIFVKMFSDPTSLGGSFFFEICFMSAFIRWEQSNIHQKLCKQNS